MVSRVENDVVGFGEAKQNYKWLKGYGVLKKSAFIISYLNEAPRTFQVITPP